MADNELCKECVEKYSVKVKPSKNAKKERKDKDIYDVYLCVDFKPKNKVCNNCADKYRIEVNPSLVKSQDWGKEKVK
jgi:hypothetical protein